MILETLKGDDSDILIYSENRFSFENNFRMIRRNIGLNNPIRLHYNEVCSYVNDSQPKTLVAYRLLTNLDNFDINYVKYGQQIVIDSVREVIYLDPIFCIKEMEDNGFLNDDPDLRFRIQQVGLRWKREFDGLSEFEESYSFDLEATEIQNQNDRSLAELLCAFDEINFDQVVDLATNETIHSPYVDNSNHSSRARTSSAESKFKPLSSDDLGFKKRSTDGAQTTGASSKPGRITGLFEEDSMYDPVQASRRVNMFEAGNKTAENKPGSFASDSDQKNARFAVLGTGRQKSVYRTTQVLGRSQQSSEAGKGSRSLFSAFLEKKRAEIISHPESDAEIRDDINSSMREFANNRENRFVVLKLKKK